MPKFRQPQIETNYSTVCNIGVEGCVVAPWLIAPGETVTSTESTPLPVAPKKDESTSWVPLLLLFAALIVFLYMTSERRP